MSVAETFWKFHNLREELRFARGRCEDYRLGRCRSKNCRFAHFNEQEAFELTKKRLQAPLLLFTQDNKALLMPPLQKASERSISPAHPLWP